MGVDEEEEPERDEHSLSLLLVGCMDSFEGTVDYRFLFDLLKSSSYPTLTKLHITLVGPEISTAEDIYLSPCVVLHKIHGGVEEVFSSASEIRDKFQAVSAMNPGLSDFFDSWHPAFKLLIDSDLLLITTGYSNIGRWTIDALFDERILTTYYGAHTISTRKHNPFFSSDVVTGKNYFYILLKGRRTEPVVTREQLVRVHQIVFMEYIGREATNFESNPQFGAYCMGIAREMRDGKRCSFQRR